MDDVKRKVLLDLFVSPYNLIPLAGGLTSLMAGWAANGEPRLIMAGLAGVLAGIGVTASRWIWGLESLTQKAYEYEVENKQQRQQQRLDDLDAKLTKDRDPRTQSCLRELRSLHANLKRAAKKDEISTAKFEIIRGVENVMDECVKQLEHSYSLWETHRKLQGPAAESLMEQRNQLIQDVVVTVADVATMVESYFVSAGQRNRSSLDQVRRELNESIEAAKRAEARTAELDRTMQSGLRE